MKIGIDIDGVLTDIESAIIDYGSKFCHDNNVEYKINIGEYDTNKILNISKNQEDNFWNRYLGEYVQTFPTRYFAKEVIDELKKKNEIYIITARNEYGLSKDLYGHMQELTKKWLEKEGIYYDKLIFSQEDKREECIKNKIDIIIEDSPSNIMLLKDVVHVFCYNNFYNQNIEEKNVTKVFSWYDILQKVRAYKNIYSDSIRMSRKLIWKNF